MKKLLKNKRFVVIATIFVLVIIVGIGFCFAQPLMDYFDVKKLTSIELDVTTPNEKQVGFMDGSLAEKNIETLKKECTLIVYGELVRKDKPIGIVPYGGTTPAIHTEYHLKPIEFFRGKEYVEDKKDIVIITLGGETKDKILVESAAPYLEIGSKYMMFLYNPNCRPGYNTKGTNYYYIKGLYQGAFEDIDGETFGSACPQDASKQKVKLKNKNDKRINEKFVLKEFRKEMQEFNKNNPVDLNIFRNTGIKNWNDGLESGFTEQEEYDRLMAGLEQYATIVEIE